MALTSEQKTAVKTILNKYVTDVHSVVSEHRTKVIQALEAADKRKVEKIDQQIKQS